MLTELIEANDDHKVGELVGYGPAGGHICPQCGGPAYETERNVGTCTCWTARASCDECHNDFWIH